MSDPPDRAGRIEELRAAARYHRERCDLYRARMFGARPTSATRMRELERAAAQAEERLAAALRAQPGRDRLQ